MASPVDPVDLGEPTTVVLVRHGRTDDTDGRRARGGGSPGPALNQPGQLQIDRLARAFAEAARGARGARAARPSALLASPQLRARQSATGLAGVLELPIEFDADWAELALGDWDGLGYGEIAAGWPEEFRAWQASTAVAPPHGESLDDVGRRVGAALDRLLRAHPGRTVLVVSHTAPIRTVIARALEAGPAALWRLRIDPASVSVVRFWADGGCEVLTVNSATPAAVG